jgi:5-methyltetrahydrofolate--homocysteine methyltransferase
VYDDIPADLLELVEDVVLDRKDDATDRLLERSLEEKSKLEAAKASGKPADAKTQQEWRNGSVEERLVSGSPDRCCDVLSMSFLV